MKLPRLDSYKIDGLSSAPTPSKKVTFVDFVRAVSGDAALSVSVVVPDETQVGDLLLVPFFKRDTITPPTGFSLIAEIRNVYTGLDQYTMMYYKIAEASDLGATLTFTCATTQREGIGLMVFHSDTGFDIEGYATATGVTTPSISATVDKSVIAAVSSNVVTSGDTLFTMSGERILQTSPVLAGSTLRICCAFGKYNSGEALSMTITNGSTATSVASVAVLIAPL